MTGLVRTYGKIIPKETTFGLSQKLRKVHFAPRIPTAPAEPVVPLPDEAALALERRRRRSRLAGSRAATMLAGGQEDNVGDTVG